MPKFGVEGSSPLMRLAYQFQGQRSRSPGPLMLTHIVRHIFRTARPTNFKLDTRMEDDDPHQPQAPRPPRSRSQGQVINLSRLDPVTLEAGAGAYRVGRTRQPQFLFPHACCCTPIFSFLVYCIYVEIYVISTWFCEHACCAPSRSKPS